MHLTQVYTMLALVQPPSDLPSLMMPTAGITKPIRPSKPMHVFQTGLLCVKTLLKLHQRSRVILHTRQYYILGLPESSA